MSPVIEVRNLTKRYGDKLALDDVSFDIEQDAIYGFLGRNGAGKTTAMSILTAQNFATSGQVQVFGEHPYENARVLSRMCFVRESQRYPDDATPRHAFASARMFFPRWDQELADELVEQFALQVAVPPDCKVHGPRLGVAENLPGCGRQTTARTPILRTRVPGVYIGN